MYLLFFERCILEYYGVPKAYSVESGSLQVCMVLLRNSAASVYPGCSEVFIHADTLPPIHKLEITLILPPLLSSIYNII